MTTDTKFNCVFCKEVFEDKAALLVHFRKHGDPNFNTKSKSRQQTEMPSTEKSGEESELVGCDVCEEVFPTISKAITHKHKAHPDHDAKYFCPFCGKLFTMKHLYNKHLQSNHKSSESSDTNDFHCDCCDVTFYVPSAMLYHNKFFHRQDTELPAFGQSKKVKTYNQELLQIYYCAFCGEEYNNKVNLHKHMGDDHGDENQSPTEILRCPLCEAIFYHLDAYELHLTFHSTADLYSEQNEMKEKVTEFSLETVSPITEKVEEEQEEDYKMNPEGIDSFLQLVMGESAGDNDASDRIKSKKHKKHKKSKKAAITLDEFLNMNKDVFGDGLDVQGIEEVPTQVVLKKVKGKKLPNKPETKMVTAKLAKLKKHGIVVKSKSGNNPVFANLNKEVNQPKITNAPNEILSKLINQGNSQIKIVKKSATAVKEDSPNPITSKSLDEPVNAGVNQDVTSDHEDEEADNSTYVDTPSVENDTNINSEKSNILRENENLNKSDPKALTKSDDNANKDNANVFENVESTSLEMKTSYNTDITLPNPITEEENSNISNGRSPNQDSKIIRDTKHDLPSDCHIVVKESLTADSNDDNSKKETETNITNTTLNALKHLSHLITVKPLNQGKAVNVSCKSNEIPNNENKMETKEDKREFDLPKRLPNEKKIPFSKSLDHLTVKPSKQSPSSSSHFNSDAESENENSEYNDDYENQLDTELDNIDELLTLNKNVVELKNLKVKNLPMNQDKISVKNQINNQTDDKGTEKTENCPKKANLDILKRLTNVTAKPITVNTSVNLVTNIKQEKNNESETKEILPNNSSKCSVDDEIEIFNIDDSDSEGNECDAVNNKTEFKPTNVPISALRNLGKNIVVKSNQQNVFPNESKDKRADKKNTRSDMGSETIKFNKKSQDIQRSINLQNKLKNLGGNITVKSRNSSPNIYNKDMYKSFEDYEGHDEGNDSDSESIGKVKITEMNENDDSGNEYNESQTNAIVESPNVSNSENEDNDGMEDDLPDFESHIKTNQLKKENTVTSNKNTCLENFKNLNKQLTIRSLNTTKPEAEDDGNLSQKEISEETPNVNKPIVTKLLKANASQNEQSINKSSQQQASGSMNQTSFNKKVATSSNQVNTVKTVKRFQSQTVIEEITTTVTKTIRTVNQSTNEVVQNRCNIIKPTIRPLKIVNKQPGKDFQGSTVRHASPTIGTKIRNASHVVRNPNPSIVRSSNQLVPVRPALCLPRLPGPSSSVVRKVAPPKCSPQRPAIGKLKISPHALGQTIKRPSEETPGHFSCFKKPKESLLNSPDMADFEDDSAVQFSSATQSRSDFSSVSKTVKGKGMVTATQTRSEVSTSSQQQLSRLSTVSGLKIMKTSSKQATQVEEKCEINTAKKNTLEALEKLQKQGLLIKKPRIDDYAEHQNSFSESDDEANDK